MVLRADRRGDRGERRRWRMKRPGGRLAKRSISTGKEKDDYFATWNVDPYRGCGGIVGGVFLRLGGYGIRPYDGVSENQT